MKIIVDMNLSPGWAGFLTRNGIEAVHWSYIGSPDADDIEILTYAKDNDFTILTTQDPRYYASTLVCVLFIVYCSRKNSASPVPPRSQREIFQKETP